MAFRKTGAVTAAIVALSLGGYTFRGPADYPEPEPPPPTVYARQIEKAENARQISSPEPLTATERTSIPEPAEPCGCPEEYTVSQDAEQPGPTLTYLGSYQIYGYDTCERCCLKTDGITASGTTATVGRTVAVNGLPFGTRLYIEGIGERIVEDRGGMEPGVIDVLCNNHAECYAITGTYDVYIIETAEVEA